MSPSTINIITNVVAFVLFVAEPIHSYLTSQPFNWYTFIVLVGGTVIGYFTSKSATAKK